MARDLVEALHVPVGRLRQLPGHLSPNLQNLLLDPLRNVVHPAEDVLRDLLADPRRGVGLGARKIGGARPEGLRKTAFDPVETVFPGGGAPKKDDEENGDGRSQRQERDVFHDTITIPRILPGGESWPFS